MSGRTQNRRTAAQWRALIAEQDRCGQSQRAFCAHNGLALSTFSLWKRRLSGAEASEGREDPSSWIDLGDLGSSPSGWDIELDLGGGVCLRLRRN
ncbi:MAG: hypothetical protein RQ723_12900 [Desulfuromonadales bacterium]|nr:hypothetical protein [Desulfuromonadales bacterium]